MEPCSRRQEALRRHLRSHQPSFLAAIAFFFCLATVHCFAGLSAAVLPLLRRVGRSLSRPPSRASFYPSRHVHDCSPRRCRHPEFSSSLISLLGSGYHFFAAFYTLATAGISVPGISSSPCCCSTRPTSERAARQAATVSTPSPGPHRRSPTPSRHLCGTSYSPLPCLASSGRAIHLYTA